MNRCTVVGVSLLDMKSTGVVFDRKSVSRIMDSNNCRQLGGGNESTVSTVYSYLEIRNAWVDLLLLLKI